MMETHEKTAMNSSGVERLEKEDSLFASACEGDPQKDGWKHRRKFILIVMQCVPFACLGAAISLLGPCLMDFALRTDISLEKATTLYSWRFGAYTLAAVFMGFLCDLLNLHLLIFVTLALAGTSIVLAPWWTSFAALCFTLIVNGAATALSQIAITAECLELWGRKSEPIMQAFQFLLAGLAVLSPLVARPFLVATADSFRKDEADSQTWNSSSAGTSVDSSSLISMNTSADNIPVSPEVEVEVLIQYPFLIFGAPILFISIFRLIFFFMDKCQWKRVKSTIKKKYEIEVIVMPRCKKTAILLLFFLMATMAGSIEVAWMGFIAGYAVKYHSWTVKDAALIPSLFWLVLTVSRLVYVVATRYIRSWRLVVVCSVCLVLNAIAMICLPNGDKIAMLSTCAVAAFFVAPLTASGVSWVCVVLGPTGFNSSLFYAGSSCGYMISPVVVANLCELFGPTLFAWSVFVLGIAMLSLVVITYIMTIRRASPNIQVAIDGQDPESLKKEDLLISN